MPMGKPSEGGGGGAFGMQRITAPLSLGGTSIANSSQGWQWLEYTNKWLLSAQSIQTGARAQPYLCDDPLTLAGLELVPNYPVVPTDTNCIWITTDRNYHYFVLRVLNVNQFWRTSHDFSTWDALSMPPFLSFMSGRQSIAVMYDTILGDILLYPVGGGAPSWQMQFSSDAGVNWAGYTLPSIVIPSTYQAEAALMTTNSGEVIFGFRDAIVHIGKPGFTPGLVFPVTATGGVGTLGNVYRSISKAAPDGRMATGTNASVLNYSLDDGLTWAFTRVFGGAFLGEVRAVLYNEVDDYFYIQGENTAVLRTLDFSTFEQVPLLSNPQSTPVISGLNTILCSPGRVLVTPDNPYATPRQYWELS